MEKIELLQERLNKKADEKANKEWHNTCVEAAKQLAAIFEGIPKEEATELLPKIFKIGMCNELYATNIHGHKAPESRKEYIRSKESAEFIKQVEAMKKAVTEMDNQLSDILNDQGYEYDAVGELLEVSESIFDSDGNFKSRILSENCVRDDVRGEYA